MTRRDVQVLRAFAASYAAGAVQAGGRRLFGALCPVTAQSVEADTGEPLPSYLPAGGWRLDYTGAGGVAVLEYSGGVRCLVPVPTDHAGAVARAAWRGRYDGDF